MSGNPPGRSRGEGRGRGRALPFSPRGRGGLLSQGHFGEFQHHGLGQGDRGRGRGGGAGFDRGRGSGFGRGRGGGPVEVAIFKYSALELIYYNGLTAQQSWRGACPRLHCDACGK
jgi:hypothetical protein